MSALVMAHKTVSISGPLRVQSDQTGLSQDMLRLTAEP
jgi:hypothetical protein